jgi:hypothetical protein
VNRIAILSNAGSGRNQRRAALLRDLDGISGVVHRVTRSAEEIPEALAALRAAAPAVLAINGGDGTVQAVLTAMEAERAAMLPIAVLPAGSTNMTAHDLGCGGRLPERLRDLLALRDRPRDAWPTESRSPLAVTDASGVTRSGFFFGTGTIVRGIEYWHAQLAHGGGAGEWGAGAALARVALGIARRQPPFADALEIGIALDDAPGETEQISFLLVTGMRRLFLGIRPFWGDGPGPLACTWVASRPVGFVRRLPALLRGQGAKLPAREGYRAARPEQVTLQLPESWVIDGEVFAQPGQVRIRSGPARPFVRLDGSPAADAVTAS